LISDNAETFKASSKEIEKLFKSQEFQRYLSNNRVSWRFIVDYDELNTLVVEVESLINSRLLTYIYDDEESISHPMTPSHLVSDHEISAMPNDEHFEIISTHNTLTRRQRHHKHQL